MWSATLEHFIRPPAGDKAPAARLLPRFRCAAFIRLALLSKSDRLSAERDRFYAALRWPSRS
jgi:hypothetical protein